MFATVFASVQPGGPLGLLVERIWEARGPAGGTGTEWRLPTGRAEMVFNLAEDRVDLTDRAGSRVDWGSVVVGPSARPFALGVAQQRHVLGVVFRPGAARAVLGVPMREIVERRVALSDLWGTIAERWHDRVAGLPRAQDRLIEMQRLLGDRVLATGQAAHPLVRPAIAALAEEPSRDAVDVADRLGFTRRRVEQVFRADVGLSPDACRRLARFRATLALIDRAADIGWGRYALERGYCDQSHLIRQFKAHAVVSPDAYMRLRGPEINHIPAGAG